MTLHFIAVDLLQRSKDSASGVMPLMNEMDHLESAVSKLQDMLAVISEYVHKVLVCRVCLAQAVARNAQWTK